MLGFIFTAITGRVMKLTVALILIFGHGSLSLVPDHKEPPREDYEVESTWNRLMDGYDKAIRPNYTGTPTMVSVDLTVMRFGKLDEVDMTFTLDLFLRQEWFDYRLQHNISEPLTPTLGMEGPADYIWTPDTVFINAQRAWSHKVTVMNTKLDIQPSGKVFWASRVSVEANCLFNLRKYPMDVQSCHVGIESYAYSTEHLRYEWNLEKDAISISNSNLSQYTLTKKYNTTEDIMYSMGAYTVLKAHFVFNRRIAFSIMQIFFPCVAIVSVSWVSLWLHKHCTSARVGIGVTTLLTISTIWGSVNRRLPRVSYVKAVDVYFMTSFSFIFMTLIEYTFVLNGNFPERDLDKKKKMQSKVHRVNQDTELNCFGRTTPRSLLVRNNAMRKRRFEELHEETKPMEAKRRKSENVTVFRLDQKGDLVTYTYANQTNGDNMNEEDNFLLLPKHEMAMKFPLFFKLYLNPRKASYVDIVSRVGFPALYFLFNLFFWIHYND